MSSVFRNINKNLTEDDIKMMHPQSLAFIGDGVYELMIRTMIMDPHINNHNLHIESAKYVNAKAQREFYEKIKSHLTSVESSVINRGKNSKLFSVPKNADINDYRWATALESLFGYLYLMNRDERIEELFKIWRNNES